jgi:hypothetical protein
MIFYKPRKAGLRTFVFLPSFFGGLQSRVPNGALENANLQTLKSAVRYSPTRNRTFYSLVTNLLFHFGFFLFLPPQSRQKPLLASLYRYIGKR